MRRSALGAALAVPAALAGAGTAAAAALLAGAPRLGASIVALAAAGVAGALAVAAAPPRPAGEPSAPAGRAALGLAVAALAICALAVLQQALSTPDGGWDAMMIWNLRARMLWHAGADVRAAFPADVVSSHPDYPFLLPALVAAGWTAVGSPAPAVPLAISLTCAASCVVVLAAGLARVAGRRAAALGVALLASLPYFPRAAADQSADVVVALFLTSAGAAAWLAIDCGSRRLLALAGLLAGAAALTKDEGALFALSLGAGILLRGRAPLRERAGDLAAFAAGAAAPVAVLLWFKLGVAPPTSALFPSEPLVETVARAAQPARLAEVLVQSARRVVFFQSNALHLVAAAVAFALLVRAGALADPAAQASRALALALALCAVGILAAYVVAPFPPRWLVRHSADRLFLQYLPLAIFWLFAAAARVARLRAPAARAYLSRP
jgi:hypothetical protein